MADPNREQMSTSFFPSLTSWFSKSKSDANLNSAQNPELAAKQAKEAEQLANRKQNIENKRYLEQELAKKKQVDLRNFNEKQRQEHIKSIETLEKMLGQYKDVNTSVDPEEQKRLERLKQMTGSSINIKKPQFENSPLGKIAHLNGLNPEGIAFGMLFEELLFFTKIGATLILGKYAPGSCFQENQRIYDSLPDDLRYDPANPGNKHIYKRVFVGGIPVDIKNDNGEKIKLDPSEVTAIDVMANGYFPKPTLTQALLQETSGYIDKILGIDAEPEKTQALRYALSQREEQGGPRSGHDTASELAAIAAARPPAPRPMGS